MKVLVLGGAAHRTARDANAPRPRPSGRLHGRQHQRCSIADVRDRIDLFRGDITLMDDVMHAMLDSRPDRVLNLAYLLGARPDGVTGDQDPHYAVRLNILGMDNCFEAAHLCGVKRVVYASLSCNPGQRATSATAPCRKKTCEWRWRVRGLELPPSTRQSGTTRPSACRSRVRPANVTGPDKVRGSTDHVLCITQPARGQPVHFRFRDAMRCRSTSTTSQNLRPGHAGRVDELPGLQLRRRDDQPRRARGPRATVPAGCPDQLREGRGRPRDLRKLHDGQHPPA